MWRSTPVRRSRRTSRGLLGALWERGPRAPRAEAVTTPMAFLETRGLTKTYGTHLALKGLDLCVEQGELFGLLGPNGAGKTTTIGLLTGLLRITSGQISVGGYLYPAGVKAAQRIMGVVPDESNLYEELDGFQNLCFCGSLYGMGKKAREERALHLLQMFGLSAVARRPFKSYSRGMRRRLTIAAAIMHRPQILFLDEPTTGIDVESARQVRRLILELHASGVTILLTTHYIEEAERLCTRIGFLVEGKLVRVGSLEQLLEEAHGNTVVELKLGSEEADSGRDLLSRQFPDLVLEQQDGRSLRVRSSGPVNLVPIIKALDGSGLHVYEARILRPSLEDVFVKVTGMEASRLRQEREGARP